MPNAEIPQFALWLMLAFLFGGYISEVITSAVHARRIRTLRTEVRNLAASVAAVYQFVYRREAEKIDQQSRINEAVNDDRRGHPPL